MDELERKLKSNNVLFVAQIISNLVKIIKDKYKPSDVKELAQLLFLKQKCLDENNIVADLATSGILSLIGDKLLENETILTYFITTIPITKNFCNLSRILGCLLYNELKETVDKSSVYKCRYNFHLPQHPFLSMLIAKPESDVFVLNEIKNFYLNRNEKYSEHTSELFRTVYLYAIYNPQEKIFGFKQNLFTFLLSIESSEEVVLDLLSWMNLNSSAFLTSELLIELAQYIPHYTSSTFELIALWQATSLYYLLLNKGDARLAITALEVTILTIPREFVTINVVVTILTKCIAIASPVYLFVILAICKQILNTHKLETYSINVLKAEILQIIANPSPLFSNLNELASEMYDSLAISKTNECKNSLQQFLDENEAILVTNELVFTEIKLNLLNQSSDEHIRAWLQSLPSDCIKNALHFLYGLFLNEKHSLLAFDLIEKYAAFCPQITPQVFNLILYELSNSKQSELHLRLLKALPRMAVLGDNLLKVVATIKALCSGPPNLYNFGLLLLLDVWKINNQIYSYLEEQILFKRGLDLETYATKAHIFKEISQANPAVYGKDMVKHLSKILNECKSDELATPCAIALEGIQWLCKAEIIDDVSTWLNLQPMFKNDTRVPVVVSLCRLLQELSKDFEDEHSEVVDNITATLWGYFSSYNGEVTAAAANALATYRYKGQCIAATAPKCYLSEDEAQLLTIKMRSAVFPIDKKSLVEILRTPSGEDFLTKLIAFDISQFLKYVYQGKGAEEPINYNYIKDASIVLQVVLWFVVQKTVEFKRTGLNDDDLLIKALRILSQKYSKPLPPLNWGFLDELSQDDKFTNYCIDIASHQVIISGSARKFMEKLIEECSNIRAIYSNLKYLANSIQPITLKPFFKRSISSVIKEEQYELLEEIIEFSIQVLRATEVQDTNKITLAEALKEQLLINDINSNVGRILIKAVAFFPNKVDFQSANLQKTTAIKCNLATSTQNTPLNHINALLELKPELNDRLAKKNLLANLKTVFTQQMSHKESPQWLLDLIGQIQTAISQRNPEDYILFLIEVLILAVAIFSGYSSLILNCEDLPGIFAQAFVALLNLEDWKRCTNQVLEWLYHMHFNESLPLEHRTLFGKTLQCFRHNSAFQHNMKWLKYLNCKV